MPIGRIFRTIVAAALAALCLSVPASAQDYPSRPITVVVPFPPGGSTNLVMRIVADKLSELLGQQIVIDNRGGAGGTVGTRSVAKSAPDGYTIGLGYTGPLAIAPTLYDNLGFDPRKDFAPIGRIGTAPNSLVVHPSFPARSIAELIAYGKANPGKINFGSAGVGTVSHLAGEYFATRAGIKLIHIPYKGTGPAITDLLGGHIPMAFAPIPASHEQAVAGSLRMLAVTSLTRSSLLPDVPTIAEAGYPALEYAEWFGVLAPARTPSATVEALSGVLRAALQTKEVQAGLANQSVDVGGLTPADFARKMKADFDRWGPIVKASGFTPLD